MSKLMRKSVKFTLAALFLCPALSGASPISDHFMILRQDSPLNKIMLDDAPTFALGDCRARISKIMCLVDPAPAGSPENYQRPCLPGGEAYAHFFESLYDRYAPSFQQIFCSLNVIYIEKSLGATAYAGAIWDAPHEHTHGAIVGIRKSLLDAGVDMSTWLSWKEQLSFGGIYGTYTLTPGLPLVHAAVQANDVDPFLYYVISHEFGHLFDFGNNVNQFTKATGASVENTWSSISWTARESVRPAYDFTERKELCFYGCNGVTPAAAHVAQTYADFYASNFITLYASTNPYDDFAEAVAFYQSSNNLGLSYVIDTGTGANYDLIEKLRSPSYAEKYEFVEAFFKRTDLQYP